MALARNPLKPFVNPNPKPIPRSRLTWFADLVRAEIRIWERIEARLMARHNCTLATYELVYFVGAYENGIPLTQLADTLALSMSRTSRLVERNVSDGILTRNEDDSDRRVSRIRLGYAGMELREAAMSIVESSLSEYIDPVLPEAERLLMQDLLVKLNAHLADIALDRSTPPDVQYADRTP